MEPTYLLRAIYDQLPDPVVVGDRKRTIISVNAAFTRQFGYESDEVAGKNTRFLYADAKDFEKLGRSRYTTKRLTGRGRSTVAYRRKNGSVFPSLTISSQITDDDGNILGFVGIVHDLTSSLEQDAQRRQLEEILSDALDTMPEGYVVYDQNDRLILCNESYRRIYDRCAPVMQAGVTFENVLRFGLLNGQFPEAGQSTEAHEEFISNRLAYHREPTGSVIRKVGPDLWVKVEDKLTRHGYRVGIRTDVSDLKRTQDELRNMNVELESKNAALRQFAAIVSHDLQAPLRHIGLYSDMLEQGGMSEAEQRGASERIAAAVDRMRRMIGSLLEYSKVAYREVEMIPVSSRTLIDEAVRILEQDIIATGARVTVEALPAVLGDSELLILVFRNLLTNALKYRGRTAPRVIFTAREQDGVVEFCVSDNGIGIDPRHADRIFQPFKRLHVDECTYKGTGIGLTLCQRIVESHGGKIWLDTEYCDGTRLRFTLPAAQIEVREKLIAAAAG